MNLSNPDARRGLRSVMQALVVLGLLGLVWWYVDRLDNEGIRHILSWAMAIILIGTVGYIMENGLRALSFKGFGVEASATQDAPAAAAAVAAAAKNEADDIADKAQ